MELSEVAKLFKEIDKYYLNRIRLTEDELIETVKAYHVILRNYDTTLILRNFYEHINTVPHPPTIADLVKKPVSEYRIPVPSVEETKQRMLMLETKNEPIDADFMDKIKREGLKKIQEGRKTHERRVAKLFE